MAKFWIFRDLVSELQKCSFFRYKSPDENNGQMQLPRQSCRQTSRFSTKKASGLKKTNNGDSERRVFIEEGVAQDEKHSREGTSLG